MLVKTLSADFLANRREAARKAYKLECDRVLWSARDELMIYSGNLMSVSQKPPTDQSLTKFWYADMDKLRENVARLEARYNQIREEQNCDLYAQDAWRHFLRRYEEDPEHGPADHDWIEVEVPDTKTVTRPEEPKAEAEPENPIVSAEIVEDAPKEPEVSLEASVMEAPSVADTPELGVVA